MSSKILSAAVSGLDAFIVEVEAEIVGGPFGKLSIVGLPDAAVSESKERVRGAIKNSGFDFPRRKIALNLAPADIKKQGPSYDLPIALSILILNKEIRAKINLEKTLFAGELALSGEIRPVQGILPIALAAREKKIQEIFVPAANAKEALLVGGINVLPVKSLAEAAGHISQKNLIQPAKAEESRLKNDSSPFDISHLRGQEQVKRAMEIAAAGAHNLLMSGPPGSGKTLAARTMASILPNLTIEESLEITKIYSVAGKLPPEAGLISSRPFRSPHHTASGAALVGGGAWPRPGEISLAHRGLLFLDEFAEFSKQTLENLRQPLEEGIIYISRASGNLSFPAKFILVAAMNPCPCGFTGDPKKNCLCSLPQISNYQKKISGPILDRIDLHVEVPRLDYEKLSSPTKGESSKEVKARVESARKIQEKRLKKYSLITNSEITSEMAKTFCRLDEKSTELLKTATNRIGLSARSYFRVLKVARTIADLAGKENIGYEHLAEALLYRPKS